MGLPGLKWVFQTWGAHVAWKRLEALKSFDFPESIGPSNVPRLN